MSEMVDFPEQLGHFIREGYDINHVSPFARTTMRSGRARQRRTFTSVPSNVSCQLLLDSAQAQLFELWFAETIQDGALWFMAPLRTPQGFKQYECRFTDMYEGPRLTGRQWWRFRCQLEIRERPLLPREWAQFPEYIAGSAIIDQAVNQEWPES